MIIFSTSMLSRRRIIVHLKSIPLNEIDSNRETLVSPLIQVLGGEQLDWMQYTGLGTTMLCPYKQTVFHSDRSKMRTYLLRCEV